MNDYYFPGDHHHGQQHPHMYNMQNPYHPMMQQYSNGGMTGNLYASAPGVDNFGYSLGNRGGNAGNFDAPPAGSEDLPQPNFGAAMHNWASELEQLFDGVGSLFSGMRNDTSGAPRGGGVRIRTYANDKGDEFVQGATRNTTSDGTGIQFRDSDRYGGTVTMTFPSNSNVVVHNGGIYMDGIRSGTPASIPVFKETIEQQQDGTQSMVLELDTSRFDEQKVRVVPSTDKVVVHIDHREELPNGEEIEQTFEIPHRLPEADPDNGGLVTYFVDGVLTIEAPMSK